MGPCLFLLIAALPVVAADNTLTEAEKKAGWKLLFDGRTYNGWLDPARRTPVSTSWRIVDGTLESTKNPGVREDLVSAEKFGDFDLTFDWKVEPGGNSGVKYQIQDFVLMDYRLTPKGMKFEQVVGAELKTRRSQRDKVDPKIGSQEYVIGFEYQVIDDDRHSDAQRGALYQAGALYSMLPAAKKAARPAGEWNQGRILKRGAHVQHWLNGVKVLDGSLDDPRIAEMAAKRWKDEPEVLNLLVKRPHKRTPISLQNHNDKASFRNLKVLPLD